MSGRGRPNMLISKRKHADLALALAVTAVAGVITASTAQSLLRWARRVLAGDAAAANILAASWLSCLRAALLRLCSRACSSGSSSWYGSAWASASSTSEAACGTKCNAAAYLATLLDRMQD